MQLEDVIRAVNALDLKAFSLENVEILQRMLPTETEVSVLLLWKRFLKILIITFIFFLGKSLSWLRHIKEKHRSTNRRRSLYISIKSYGTSSNETSGHVLHGKLFRQHLFDNTGITRYTLNIFDEIYYMSCLKL